MFVLAVSLGKARTSPTASVNLTVTVMPFGGLVVELYDESGELIDRTEPAVPPLDVTVTTPDQQQIGLYVPETTLDGPTAVQVHLKGTAPTRGILDQADSGTEAKGITAFPGAQVIEFTATRDLGTTATITLPYPSSLDAAIVNNLKIFELDDVNPSWVVLPGCRTNPRQDNISGDVNDFSTYRVMAMAAGNLRDVVVYPNPFRPKEAHDGCIKFINLTSQARVRIYNVVGDLIWTREIENSGGSIQWYGDNNSGRPVASGVYVYIVTNPDGEEAVGKISVIR